jgi:hypothetical protein
LVHGFQVQLNILVELKITLTILFSKFLLINFIDLGGSQLLGAPTEPLKLHALHRDEYNSLSPPHGLCLELFLWHLTLAKLCDEVKDIDEPFKYLSAVQQQAHQHWATDKPLMRVPALVQPEFPTLPELPQVQLFDPLFPFELFLLSAVLLLGLIFLPAILDI